MKTLILLPHPLLLPFLLPLPLPPPLLLLPLHPLSPPTIAAAFAPDSASALYLLPFYFCSLFISASGLFMLPLYFRFRLCFRIRFNFVFLDLSIAIIAR